LCQRKLAASLDLPLGNRLRALDIAQGWRLADGHHIESADLGSLRENWETLDILVPVEHA
jgi:hypothetical protein